MTPSSVALVTGAGRGIGAALSRALSAAGMGVGLLGRDRAQLQAVAADCTRSVVTVADVTDAAQVRAAVDLVAARLGPVDLLVNNAGRIEPEEVPFGSCDLDALWAVVHVNLRGTLVVTRAVLPGMVAAGGGRIVSVNSSLAYRRAPAYTGYAISKAGVARLTDLVAAQYAQAGVRAFDLAAAAVATDMTAGLPRFAGKTDWLPPTHVVPLVLAIAEGRLDELSGRFLSAAADDVDELLAAGAAIHATDARVVALRTYGTDDPLESPAVPWT